MFYTKKINEFCINLLTISPSDETADEDLQQIVTQF